MRAVRFVAAGAAVGAGIGAAEGILALLGDPWWALHAPVIPAAMLLYGAVGSALGFLAGLLRGVSGRGVWVALGGILYLLGVFHIVKPFLPQVWTFPCLLRTLVWTVSWCTGWLLAWKRSNRRGADAAFPGAGGGQKAFVGGLALLAGIGLCGPWLWSIQQRTPEGPAKEDRPNIVIVVMDTARADHFSCYGYSRPTTPHVDRLAQEGVLFEQAVSTAPWTLPSHASLFTGLYASQHGTDRPAPWLSGSLLTLAELLKGEGYQTAGFSNNPWVGPGTNFHQGFDLFEGMWKGSGPVHRLALVWAATRLKDRLGEKITNSSDAAATNARIRWWLDRVRRDASPSFLFVNYIDVHGPYRPREPFRSRFLREPHRMAAGKLAQARLKRTAPPVHLDPVTEGVLIDLYDGELAYLDAKVGDLIGMLKERGLLDPTLLIVTSDHGENFGEHRQLGHRFCIYETLLRVPLILRYPNVFSGGLRVKEPVSLIDVLPTLMQLVRPEGARLPPGLLGRSLLAVRGEGSVDRPLVSEYTAPVSWIPKYRKSNPGMDEGYFTRNLKSVRRGNLKFIWGSDGRHEAYDLKKDPAETTNLAEQRPEMARQLKEEAERLFAALQPVGSAKDSWPMDENIRREIRALGYVQ